MALPDVVTADDRAQARDELRDQLRRLLTRYWGPDGVRAYLAGETGAELNVIAMLASQMSIDALLTPVERGGLGAGCYEAAIAMEELGRALVPHDPLAPWMAASLPTHTDSSDRPGTRGLAWPGADSSWSVETVAVGKIQDGRLHGHFSCVALPRSVTRIVVPAKIGPSYCAATFDVAEANVREVRVRDPLRRLVDIDASGVPVAVLSLDAPAAIFERSLAIGATCLAAEMLGTAEFCLEKAVEYAKSRVQFHQPIGKFQAIRHMLADVFIALAGARSSIYRCAQSLDSPTDSSGIVLARIAKTRASAALRTAAETAVQVHGALGFTWEVPLHLAVKKWGTSANLLGSVRDHELAICHIEIGGATVGEGQAVIEYRTHER